MRRPSETNKKIYLHAILLPDWGKHLDNIEESKGFLHALEIWRLNVAGDRRDLGSKVKRKSESSISIAASYSVAKVGKHTIPHNLPRQRSFLRRLQSEGPLAQLAVFHPLCSPIFVFSLT